MLIEALQQKWKHDYAMAIYYRRVKALRYLLRLIDAGAGTSLRSAIRKVKDPGPRKVIALPEEQQRLFAIAQPWLRFWMLLCSQLALRNAEARSIGPQNYDKPNGVLRFRKKGGGEHILPITRNSRPSSKPAPKLRAARAARNKSRRAGAAAPSPG